MIASHRAVAEALFAEPGIADDYARLAERRATVFEAIAFLGRLEAFVTLHFGECPRLADWYVIDREFGALVSARRDQ